MGIRSTAASLDYRLWLRSFSLLETDLSQTFIATVSQPQRRLRYACLELLFSYLNLRDPFNLIGCRKFTPLSAVFLFVPCLRELSNFWLFSMKLFIISEDVFCSSWIIGSKNGMECVFEWSLKEEANKITPRNWITRSFEEIINRRYKTQK